MTKGDKKWISNWKPTGGNMKPIKKKPAKRVFNPLLSKLLDLKYRISQEKQWYDQRDGYTKANKEWVAKLLKDVALNDLTTLCREDMQACNRLWRDYERK